MQSNQYIEGPGLLGWYNLLLYVFIPLIVLWKSNFRLPGFFGAKTSIAALPFAAVYTIAFIFIKGISITNLLTLTFIIVWPALGEEFLFRGLIQRVFTKVIKNPITAIVLTSILFTANHIPIYLFEYTGSSVTAFSSLLPVMLTSFFWGYGYYRTGVLWPWILIHALSNIVGF